MKLYRFKSNKNTIVQHCGKKHVQTVWTEDYPKGYRSSFLYLLAPENLIPLTKEECREIVSKRNELGIVSKIGR